MNVLDSSLAYRFAAWVVNGFMVSGRDSFAGRFLIAFAQGISRACAGSVSLGLRRAGARPLTRSGHPVVLLVIARPYLWLRGVLAPVAAYGRLRVRESRFARGNWLVVVGAGAFALGCGRLSAVFREGVTAGRVVVVVILVAGGALLAVSAPRLVSALKSSLLVRGTRRLAVGVVQGGPKGALAAGGQAADGGRGTTSAGESVPRTAAAARRISRDPLLLASIGLALAAGLAGGISTSVGPAPIVAVGAVIILAALVLHRPEVFFLVGAAFPWVDWAARHSLGGLGAAWDDAFLLLSIALLVWAVLFLRRAELWTVPVLLPLILAFVAAIGSVVVNRVPGNVGIFALRVLFQPILFYLLGFLFPKNKRWIQWAVSLFIVASVAMALHGLYQYVTHAPMPASWIDVHEGDISTRAYSIVENPNGLGAFLLLGTLLTLSLALRS
ncbi:MAG: hypothetical protein M1274_07450, partial [Actinobacteria bacterium]|nr:hypothetical protein [Actinomycetota bacterium]